MDNENTINITFAEEIYKDLIILSKICKFDSVEEYVEQVILDDLEEEKQYASYLLYGDSEKAKRKAL